MKPQRLIPVFYKGERLKPGHGLGKTPPKPFIMRWVDGKLLQFERHGKVGNWRYEEKK